MRYRSNDDYAAQSVHMEQQVRELRQVIIELAAALVRMDRNGYQQRTLERACERSGVTPEEIANYNWERAARIAARKGDA
jgi:hypothetical protein